MNRRTFLQAGSLGLGVLGLPNLADSAVTTKHDKSVIFLFLSGGIAHQESMNASPNYTEKARSVNGYVHTKHGFTLGGTLQKLGSISHLFSPVHSYGHINASHGSATHYNMTGYNATGEEIQNHPSYGSIISKTYGASSQLGVPTYVAVNRTHADGANYLGNANNPFNISEEGKRNLQLNIDTTRFNQRMDVLASLDRKFLAGKTNRDIDAYKRQGREMLLGRAREMFDISKESQQVLDKYGKNDFAQKFLLARRLVENGVKFVTLNLGGWDMHSNISQGFAKKGPELDHGLATLLEDLEQRSMLDSTLVVVTSEFSRTLINANSGRDHFPGLTTLVLAGKNYGGRAIGESNKDGMFPKDNPFRPIDLLKTITNHMEIGNPQFLDNSGRPRNTIESDAKVII